MNARIILAQGALESGWGTSMLATEHHNFFGLMGYGASNAYWHGQRATFETAYGTHHFRHYEATHLSFLDFARLIRSAYPRAYHFSFQPEAYAKEIAYSPYISEQNGDNRDLYRRNIIALEAEIGKQLELFQWTMNNGQSVKNQIQAFLKEKGHTKVSIYEIEPSVEDCFMQLSQR